MLKALLFVALFYRCLGQSWHDLNHGVFGTVNSLSTISDGSGGYNLLLGGYFVVSFSGTTLPGIAIWDGTSFSNIFGTSGVNNDCLTVDGESIPGKIIAGGDFTDAGGLGLMYVALFDLSTNSWSAAGNGLNDIVWSSYMSGGGTIYVTGYFTQSGTTSINRIATFDGTAFAAVGQGVENFGVYSTMEYNGDIYVGGMFSLLGSGLIANNIASWDGSSWNPIMTGTTNGLDGSVYDLMLYNSDLLVVGAFTHAGAVNIPHIALWDGTNWSPFGNVDLDVYCAEMHNGELYIGGIFSSIDLNPIYRVARYNGSQWLSMNSGMSAVTNSVITLKSVDNILYVGGSFTVPLSGGNAHNILAWY